MCQHYSAKTTGHWYCYLQSHCGDTRWQCRYNRNSTNIVVVLTDWAFHFLLCTIKHVFVAVVLLHSHVHTHTHNYLHILVSPDDYTSVSMILHTFTSQQPRQCFNVSIMNDINVEITETFTARLTLIPASVTTITENRIIVDPPEATVQITNNVLSKL